MNNTLAINETVQPISTGETVFGFLFFFGVIAVALFMWLYSDKQEKIKEKMRKSQEFANTFWKLKIDGWSEAKIADFRDSLKGQVKNLSYNLEPEHKIKLQKFYKKCNNLIKAKIEHKEKLQQQKDEAQKNLEAKRTKEKFTKDFYELYNFKFKKKSEKALPVNKEYSKEVIEAAERHMRTYLSEKRYEKWIREEALEYYSQNDTDTKPPLDGEKEYIYEQVRNEIIEGKTKVKKQIASKYSKNTFPNNFYRAKDLDEDEKRKAAVNGFTHVRGNELDGYICGGGFYIRKENPRESKWHFIMKHQFTELHDNIYLERMIEGKRADATFLYEGFKLAIEIESGANKEKAIIEKLEWLQKNFDQFIFVVPRKELARYSRYVDDKNSFCMTPKKAKEFIEEMIAPLEDQCEIGETL